MLSLLRGEPDVVIRSARALILAGMLLGYACARLEIPGVISAVFAVGLGASGGCLVQWRTDRGLWMLAGLFLLINSGIWTLVTCAHIFDIIRGVPQGDVGLTVDFGMGSSLLSSTLRFNWRVAK